MNKRFNPFPENMSSDYSLILKMFKEDLSKLRDSVSIICSLDSEEISIPYRIYNSPSSRYKLKSLNPNQELMKFCILTRHHDGFVRQENLQKIFLRKKISKWCLPFILQLCGEYIEEILININDEFDLINTSDFKSFINHNLNFYNKTKSRIVSYWNVYYRVRYISGGIYIILSKENYVGYKLIEKLDNLLEVKALNKPLLKPAGW